MDFETKVKILKEHGFEECGDRRIGLRIDDLSNYTEEQKKKIEERNERIDKYSFLLRYEKSINNSEKPIFYSEEYIRNTDLEKILNPIENVNIELEELLEDLNKESLKEYVEWINEGECSYRGLDEEERGTALKILNKLDGHLIIRAEKILNFCKKALQHGDFKIKE